MADYSPESDGSSAWHSLVSDDALRKKVNHWLSDSSRLQTPYRLLAREYIEKQEFSNPKKLGQGSLNGAPTYSELVLLDMRTNTVVTHRDVGVGISQILPVLVAAYGATGKVIAVEQPELHLHPALQAELADVFIESALETGRNLVIIETHSENLVLRLLRRIREAESHGLPKITPEDVAVLCVVPTEKGSVVYEIPVAEHGDFAVPWPTGFFSDERRKEWL